MRFSRNGLIHLSTAGAGRAYRHTAAKSRARRLLWGLQTQRPAAATGTLSVTSAHGRVPLELASQLIHWRKADLLNPTDAIAPVIASTSSTNPGSYAASLAERAD